MARQNSVILVEFNELSPILMERFMAARILPNFQRFYNEAHVYTTDAAEKAPYLDPWIQWVTVHTGLTYDEHQVFHLGDAHKLKSKRLWDIASDAGLPVWVCGSMNSFHVSPLKGYFLPDPWASEVRPQPPELLPYFHFIQMNVLEHTNDRIPLGARDYMRFLGFMLRHGLSASTVAAAVRQILSEKDGQNNWRRATILDKLQFDMFRSIHRKLQPRFSTFFSNSTAHFQHKYWRHMEPDVFQIKPTEKELADYRAAIRIGYQEMDTLIGQLIKMAEDGTTLVFCTALSQQPCLIYEEQGGKIVYRPHDFEAILRFAGVTAPHSVAPVMAEEFHVRFAKEADARDAVDRLSTLHVGGRPALAVELRDGGVFAGCQFYTALPEDSKLCLKDSSQSVSFFEVFYRLDESLKSGMHNPDGMLWIRKADRSHCVYPTKVPLTSIAPTILDLLSIPRGDFMRGEPLRFAA